MIFDFLQQEPDPGIQLDVCVVGAGAAGITLAVELSRSGRSVYLLEAGGSTLELQAQEPCKGETSLLPHRGLHSGRFRIQGGTTTQWGGQILELDDIDFERRPWVEGSGWPFSKSTLLPFYRRATHLEGIAKSISSDEEVWQRIGVPSPVFPDLLSYLSRWCPEPNFSDLHAMTLKGSAVHLWLHSNAVELIHDGDTTIGVRASTQTGKSVTFRARHYVFCLGAIESTRFFLQPRDGRLPWNDSGLLGLHFQDHIDCNVGILKPRSLADVHTAFDSIFLRGFKYQPKLKLPAEEQANARILNVAATLAFESDTAETMAQLRTTAKQLMQGKLGSVSIDDLLRMARHSYPLLRQTHRYLVKHRSYQPAHSNLSLRIHCEQEPCSQSSITLSSERDTLGMLRTRLGWHISSLERRTIRHFANILKRSLSGLGELHLDPSLADDAALTARCEDSFHHMGGMRMDSSPSKGVVDTNLKLHGMRNTYVCSSAVFPTSGFSNPTHTLLALTMRLADHLLQQ